MLGLRRRTLTVAVLVLALAGAAIGAMLVARADAELAEAPELAIADRGRISGALDAPNPQSMTLSEALGRINRRVPLPDVALTGDAVRAEIDDWDGKKPSEYGLLVLYSSGLKLMVEPGVLDVGQKASSGRSARFSDGDSSHYKEVRIGNRQALLVKGGTQILTIGEYAVPDMVAWNDAGFTYRLQAEPGVFSTEQLLQIAESVR